MTYEEAIAIRAAQLQGTHVRPSLAAIALQIIQQAATNPAPKPKTTPKPKPARKPRPERKAVETKPSRAEQPRLSRPSREEYAVAERLDRIAAGRMK